MMKMIKNIVLLVLFCFCLIVLRFCFLFFGCFFLGGGAPLTSRKYKTDSQGCFCFVLAVCLNLLVRCPVSALTITPVAS